MHYGFRIVEDMVDGLSRWMDSKGFANLAAFRGLSLPRVTQWQHLDLNYKIVARIDPATCIGCQLCYTACWDGAHQCIHVAGYPTLKPPLPPVAPLSFPLPPLLRLPRHASARIPKVDEHECVGCNLCWLVCPVENCISMVRVDKGDQPQSWSERVNA